MLFEPFFTIDGRSGSSVGMVDGEVFGRICIIIYVVWLVHVSLQVFVGVSAHI